MARPSLASLCRWGAVLTLGFSALAHAANTVNNTILILAKDVTTASSASSGLQGYGIPYQVVPVPSTGITLPTLNSSATQGNYGAIVVVSEVSYNYNGSYSSALTTAQWQQLYSYQVAFGVRMVRLDVYPGPDFGCTAYSGTSTDSGIWLTDNSTFPTANIKAGAVLSVAGLYHYPASITNTSIAKEIAKFGAADGIVASTAAVINTIGKRQQMVFFLPFATDWSATSNFLQHAWIHWATRGFYNGFRRLYFSTQIDDVFLVTDIYKPAGRQFRVRPGDLQAHKDWMPQVNARMPLGSKYIIELAHNGNGDIESSIGNDTKGICSPASAIEYADQIDTALEFQKPLGSGTDIWPNRPTTYTWSLACAQIDPLLQWLQVPANLNSFMHISHTFSHEALNNATYSDTNKEILFNKAWFSQTGIGNATYFSANGLIPPAITGLHNGDAIQAWMNNGIMHVVGDNTRPVLRNPINSFWPLISTVPDNGFANLTIMPRWATNIYYNCDTPDCTAFEWFNTSAGIYDITALLQDARATNSRNLLALHQDPYMFHQANLRQIDQALTTVIGKNSQWSLLQTWVETIVEEMVRLTDWPLITKKHDDLAVAFLNRMARDNCLPSMTFSYSADGTHIVGGTVYTGTGNSCGVTIPVTFPGPVKSSTGMTSEQIGHDPLTIWVPMKGSPVPFTLITPISVT